MATSSQSTFAHNKIVFAITDLFMSNFSHVWPKNVSYLGIWELRCLSLGLVIHNITDISFRV